MTNVISKVRSNLPIRIDIDSLSLGAGHTHQQDMCLFPSCTNQMHTKLHKRMIYNASILLALAVGVALFIMGTAMPPMGIIASVRGKKIEVEAETVEEVSLCVQEKCGLDASEQSVLFRGKVLSATDKLEDIGVAPGDILNVVKGKRQRTKPISDADISDMPSEDEEVRIQTDAAATNPFGGAGMGMDEESMKRALENMNPEDIQKAMKQIDQLLDNK